MKKLIGMLTLFAILAAMLSACRSKTTDEPQAAPGTYTLDKAPALTIAPLDKNVMVDSVTIQPGNYSWSWPKGNGEEEAVEACGFGPTDPAILSYLDPIPLTEAVAVKLLWPSFPAQGVRIVSWEIGVLDLAADADQAAQNSCLREVTLAETEDFERTMLLEPDRVYDIYANWQEVNGSSYGNAHYYVVTKADGTMEGPQAVITGG